MINKDHRSKCCGAEVKTEGLPDFIGSKDICTIGFICLKCNKACDVIKTVIAGIIEINLNDDIEVRLTREGRQVYRKHYRKYRLDPLTLKKSRGRWVLFHLWDFMHIFGDMMYMGAPQVIVGNLIRILPRS